MGVWQESRREAEMKTWFILLLLVCVWSSVSCRRRRRCPRYLKMNRRGRCIKAWGLTEGHRTKTRAMERLAQHLKGELGRDVLIPCHDSDNQEHCEVCFKNDPGKIFCPKSEWNKKSPYTQEFRNASVSDDLTDWMCSTDPENVDQAEFDGLVNGFSYWTGYDDGSICDCGTPFVAEWEGSESVSFRPLMNTEERPGFQLGPTYVIESTGAPRWRSLSGDGLNEEWENLGEEEKRESYAVWDSRPPTAFPIACPQNPDISSIFELSFKQDEEYKWNLVPKNSNDCILEDTYFAWYNGEPIATESRQDEAGDHRWCDANSECGGWTLNKSNGWCALKRSDQIKKQGKKNFVSGIKKLLGFLRQSFLMDIAL